MTRTLRAAVVALIAVALAACSSGGSPDPDPDTSLPHAVDSEEIAVSAFEFGYDLATPTAPGTYTFALTNDGSMTHDLVLEGDATGSTSVIGPGESDSFTVVLEPGTYTLYCSVGNHRAQGMELTFTIDG